jgi:predicted metal-binding protein
MKTIVEKIKEVLEPVIWQSAVATTDVLKFQEEVVASCKMNYCGMYGKTWMCPPGVGELQDLKNKYTSYKNIFVFTTKHSIEDSFDIEGMGEARLLHQSYDELIVKALEGENYKLLGAGGCSICSKCTYPERPCAFPEKAHPSVEACGINVVELSADLGINYVNGENTVTYFSVIFF